MRRRAVAMLVVAATVAAGCSSDDDEPAADESPTPSASASVQPSLSPGDPLAEYYEQEIRWSSCDGGDDANVECATVKVPLTYQRPDGTVIDLALLRVPATGDDPIGSLLVNPGGPGGSGLDYARAARSITSEAVREQYHIVGFDPRGVGESTPIDCLDDSALDDFVAIDGSPDGQPEVEALQAATSEFAAACERRSGELLPHIGTQNVARDLDVLRAVLGDESLHYLGKSYGTYIGATYAQLFPERVGRVVLDGAMDPALSGEAMALGQVKGFERALSQYIDHCLEDGECPLGQDEQEARETLAGLLDVIDANPLATEDEDRPLTQSLAILGIVFPLYLTPEQGYEALTQALSAAQAGDGSALLALADVYLARDSDGTYQGNQNEVIYAVNCIDRPDAESRQEIESSVQEFRAASPIIGPFLAWGGLACANWPVQPTSTPAPVNAAGADPIMVIGTTGDPATPYPWAEALASQLQSAVLITYEGSVHTAYRNAGDECVDSAVDEYLLDGTVPESDVRCS